MSNFEINKIYNENCLDTMKKMNDNFVDLTVTSPPYDNIRDYNGYEFDWKPIIKELYRVTKIGGVVVWIVGDQTINGSETGTSFKQALYAKDVGFNLHDTMIYQKPYSGPCGSMYSYTQSFEYMFVLSKGIFKKNNLIEDYKTKNVNCIVKGKQTRSDKNGYGVGKTKIIQRKTFVKRTNIWELKSQENDNNYKHPAKFPEKLANDHILSWSNENDIVYDPFMGSGTTAKMSIINNRKYIGSEISKEYCEIIEKRINEIEIKQKNIINKRNLLKEMI